MLPPLCPPQANFTHLPCRFTCLLPCSCRPKSWASLVPFEKTYTRKPGAVRHGLDPWSFTLTLTAEHDTFFDIGFLDLNDAQQFAFNEREPILDTATWLKNEKLLAEMVNSPSWTPTVLAEVVED